MGKRHLQEQEPRRSPAGEMLLGEAVSWPLRPPAAANRGTGQTVGAVERKSHLWQTAHRPQTLRIYESQFVTNPSLVSSMLAAIFRPSIRFVDTTSISLLLISALSVPTPVFSHALRQRSAPSPPIREWAGHA